MLQCGPNPRRTQHVSVATVSAIIVCGFKLSNRCQIFLTLLGNIRNRSCTSNLKFHIAHCPSCCVLLCQLDVAASISLRQRATWLIIKAANPMQHGLSVKSEEWCCMFQFQNFSFKLKTKLQLNLERPT